MVIIKSLALGREMHGMINIGCFWCLPQKGVGNFHLNVTGSKGTQTVAQKIKNEAT